MTTEKNSKKTKKRLTEKEINALYKKLGLSITHAGQCAPAVDHVPFERFSLYRDCPVTYSANTPV